MEKLDHGGGDENSSRIKTRESGNEEAAGGVGEAAGVRTVPIRPAIGAALENGGIDRRRSGMDAEAEHAGRSPCSNPAMAEEGNPGGCGSSLG